MAPVIPVLKSLAVILPRYGAGLGGGAEALVQSLVEHLAPEKGPRLVERVEVWTTCAKDHRTWANFYPEGQTLERGIPVHRFAVQPIAVDAFLKAEFAMRDGRVLTVDEQLEWLAAGVNSRELYLHIAQHGGSFDALLFAPYLFSTTFWGALIHPDRSLLLPCLHNEHYAYQSVFKHLFARVRGLIFNAEPEMELAAQLYGPALVEEKGSVVGMGFAPVREVFFTVEESLPPGITSPYILYSGRKEEGKNLDLLIRYMEGMREATGRSVSLVLIGSGDIQFRDSLPEGVFDLGFVSEEEKERLMRGALALCQPSVNESFSIVMMEAWLRRTPVIVHGNCAVTRDHVVRSSGGLYFTNEAEFYRVVGMLLDDPSLRESLGENGRSYVVSRYSWPVVLDRFRAACEKCGLGESYEHTNENTTASPS